MLAKSLPSMFTIANLFLGIISIIFVFNNKHELAAMMVIIAMLADGLDGRVARALNAQSEFGRELDSLSDVISFGVAPAFIMYVVAFQEMQALGWIVTAIFPICGALRLARFNVISGNHDHFVGLPIPAAGGILSTLALFYADIPVFVLLICTILLSALMVSNIKYPNFKKMGFSRTAVWITPLLAAGALALAFIYPGYITKFIFIPLVIYALYGLKKNGNEFGLRGKKKPIAINEEDEYAEFTLEMEEPARWRT